jgi:argininosuccinate synthase
MNIETILAKIAATQVPKVKRVAVAFSGGLDSSLGIELLRRVYKAEEIFPITVDIGQGEEEMQHLIRQAKALNITPIIIDARKEFAED